MSWPSCILVALHAAGITVYAIMGNVTNKDRQFGHTRRIHMAM